MFGQYHWTPRQEIIDKPERHLNTGSTSTLSIQSTWFVSDLMRLSGHRLGKLCCAFVSFQCLVNWICCNSACRMCRCINIIHDQIEEKAYYNAFLVEALIIQNAGTVIMLIVSGLLFDVTLCTAVYDDTTCINWFYWPAETDQGSSSGRGCRSADSQLNSSTCFEWCPSV